MTHLLARRAGILPHLLVQRACMRSHAILSPARLFGVGGLFWLLVTAIASSRLVNRGRLT